MLPLDDLFVLDLSRHLPGPFCSLLLADLGADVVKVEDRLQGDPLRWLGESIVGRPGVSATFAALNRNKRSVQMDLTFEEDKAVFLQLVRRTDILLDSFRPGVMEKFGLGYETLKQVNPKLIYCPMSGYGQHSSFRERPGHDLNFVARSGLLALTGPKEGPPIIPAGQIADIGSAFMATIAILTALRARDRSQVGTQLDIALFDGAFPWLFLSGAAQLAGGQSAQRGELPLAGLLVCYRVYRCADDRWVALAALEEKFWRAFCEGIGREDLLQHHYAKTGSQAAQTLEAIFRERTREEWELFAQQHHCCLDPVLELDEAFAQKLVQERELVHEIQVAEQQFMTFGSFVGQSFAGSAVERFPAPLLGEHNGEILRELTDMNL